MYAPRDGARNVSLPDSRSQRDYNVVSLGCIGESAREPGPFNVLFWNAGIWNGGSPTFGLLQRGTLPRITGGHTRGLFGSGHTALHADLRHVRWSSHCRNLVQLPVAA